MILRQNGSSSPELTMKYIFDYIFFGFLFIYIFLLYNSISDKDQTNIISNLIEMTIDWYNDPITLPSSILFLIVFYFAIYLLELPMNDEFKPYSIHFLESKIWIVLVTVLIFNFFKYLFGVNILITLYENTGMNKFLHIIFDSHSTDLDKNKKNTSGNTICGNGKSCNAKIQVEYDEVFNISNNLYTYDDAKAICKSYGARIANYNDIEQAYSSGGEWCNYGWSDGQMAFFPTQKKTWDKLQTNEKTKHNCGRPGINGGYIENPYIKFGVNCFGKKPPANDTELNMMNAKQNQIVPKTEDEILLDKKVEFWKENSKKLLQINSFNLNQWSEY